MSVFPRLLLPLLLACAPARAAGWAFPPVEGELRGELTPTLLAGAPTVQWTVVAQRVQGDRRVLSVVFEGKGLHARVEAQVRAGTGEGTWKIVECTIDLAPWLPAIIAKASPGTAGLVAEGQLSLNGEGTLRNGLPAGTVSVVAAHAALRDKAAGWAVEGVSGDGSFGFDAATGDYRSTKPANVSVATITTKRFGARNLRVRADLKNPRVAELLAATIEIAGGDVVAAPAPVPLQPVNVQLDLKFRHIGLQDIAQFVPNAVAEAYGLVDGVVHVGWTSQKGIEVGQGSLAMRRDEPVTVRLMQFPGLITGNIPRDVGAYMALYDNLHRVEIGKAPIQADSLEVSFTPQGDNEGRQAFVHVVGRIPGSPSPLDLTVNVRGPISDLIRMSADSRLHFGSGK